jgi:hypothetical protein
VKRSRSSGLHPPQKDQTSVAASASAIPVTFTADEPTAAPNPAIHLF